ncbi:serine/threonine-protein kinase [Micromonospora mirobrigensis]|uniref:serine/threonine-protein kinase n=1 Tax=Micromonospora mirobrigensis TaxID=262898 RepID=UPI00159F27EA|nr:serine/threonine-protein kinase [Micromonospora mirobrigensis]
MSRLLGGRYRTEELLGSGGMAAVWRGRDLRLDRPVAVKVLTGAGLDDPTALDRFDREARAVARLTHPHIVAVYDFGTDDGDPYLVMELVEGATVSALIGRGPMPVAQAVAIAEQTCDGLVAAHEAGVVHRDIKPGNLIVTPTGIVKICDFGIARLAHDGENTLTNAATRLGTSSYMSPEQAVGGAVDSRTDLYGLGCTLYAMLTGIPPFTGDPLHVLHQHLHDPAAAPSSRRADVPTALDALVAELLAKEPADRPADAAQVRDRLAAIRAELPGAHAASVPLAPAAAAAAAGPAHPAGPWPVAGGVPFPRPDARPAVDRADPPTDRRRQRHGLAAVLGVLAVVALLAVVVASQLTGEDDDPVTPPPVAAPTAAVVTQAAPSPVVTVTAAPATTEAPPSTPAPSTRTTSAAPATRSAAPTSAPASKPPRTVSPSPSPPPPSDPIVAIRLSIKKQVDTGQLSPDAARDLYAKVDAIAKDRASDDPQRAKDDIKKFRDKLTELNKGGKLTDAGYAQLTKDINRVAAELN